MNESGSAVWWSGIPLDGGRDSCGFFRECSVSRVVESDCGCAKLECVWKLYAPRADAGCASVLGNFFRWPKLGDGGLSWHAAWYRRWCLGATMVGIAFVVCRYSQPIWAVWHCRSFVMSTKLITFVVCTSWSESTVKGRQRRNVLTGCRRVALMRYRISFIWCTMRELVAWARF